MYFVYVLKSTEHPKSYVGITNDIARRLEEHNAGKHVYTKQHKPWHIVYREEYPLRSEARQREKYLKSAAGRKFLTKEVFK